MLVRRGQLNADAGFAQVDGSETKENRDGGDDLEEDDGTKTEPSHLPQVGVSSDADYQGPEKQRRNDGLNQAQEDEREHAQVNGDVGKVVPDLGAQQHGDEDPGGERASETTVDQQRSQREPAQGREKQCRGWAADLRVQQRDQRSDGRDEKCDVLAAMAGLDHDLAQNVL